MQKSHSVVTAYLISGLESALAGCLATVPMTLTMLGLHRYLPFWQRHSLPPEKITMGAVIDFFLTRHPAEPDWDSPILRALQKSMAPGQQKFAKLTLAHVSHFPSRATRSKSPAITKLSQTRQKGSKVRKFNNSQAQTKG